MRSMANLVVDADTVTVSMSALEKAEAIHGDVIVPRSAVTSVRAVPNGMAEIRGLRMPGTGFPGVVMVGTWRSGQDTTFAVCHGHGPAVVIDLAGQYFDRIVLTVDDPDEAVARFS